MIKMPDEKKSWLKGIIRTYIGEVLSFYADLVKRKIRKYTASLIVAASALTVIIYGTGSLLGSFFPEWRPGISHIVTGIAVMLIALVYRKYDE